MSIIVLLSSPSVGTVTSKQELQSLLAKLANLLIVSCSLCVQWDRFWLTTLPSEWHRLKVYIKKRDGLISYVPQPTHNAVCFLIVR